MAEPLDLDPIRARCDAVAKHEALFLASARVDISILLAEVERLRGGLREALDHTGMYEDYRRSSPSGFARYCRRMFRPQRRSDPRVN